MKRVLCAALLGGAALAVPAYAGEPLPVHVWNDANRVGVYATYGDDEPLGGVWVNHSTGEACVGLSYQIPQCVGIETGS